LLYVSTSSPTYPLYVDVSIYDQNGTLEQVHVVNGNTGRFYAVAESAGTNPTFQWKLNGSDVGTDTNIYINTTLTNGDTITCEITPDMGGCSKITYESLPVYAVDKADYTFDDFYVYNQSSDSSCQEAIEAVTWKTSSLLNVSVSDNNLAKIQSDDNWDGAATSLNQVYNNGYLYTVVNETNQRRRFGLSNNTAGNGYGNIEYSFYLRNNGTIQIWESNNNRGDFGAYNAADTMKILVDRDQVKYYRNSTLLYISGNAPTYPLYVDVSIYDQNGTLEDVHIVNGNTGNFYAVAQSAGADPNYQWKLNGVNVGSDTNCYSNDTLSDGDTVICEITPDLGGCSSTIYQSLPVYIRDKATYAFDDFYVYNLASDSACKEVKEQVTWETATLDNVEATGNNLVKVQSDDNWDGGATSLNTVYNNGYFYTVINEANQRRVFGLSSIKGNSHYNSIEYALYARDNGALYVYESGTQIAQYGTYSSGDTIMIKVEQGQIQYYKNSILLYTSTNSPTFPLYVDVSIYDQGGTLEDVTIVNGNTGRFYAVANSAGSNPSYQWQLNGSDIGTDTNIYVNDTLNDGDTITCLITPDLGGCRQNVYESAPVITIAKDEYNFGDYYIYDIINTATPQVAITEVTWTDIVNVVVTNGIMQKSAGGDSWGDGGAASFDSVGDNGYMYMIVSQTSDDRIIGLSDQNTNAHLNTIDFGFYLNGGVLRVRESGTTVANLGGYNVGDTLKIAIESGTVRYYRNSTLQYNSAASPASLPMIVDCAIEEEGAKLGKTYVVNGNSGNFYAVATAAGTNPSYQWKLNAADVGTDTNVYSNTSLDDGDYIICEITPDLGACANNPLSSKTIFISGVSTPDKPTKPVGADTVCQNSPDTIYRTTTTANADSYEWVILNGGSSTITGTDTAGTVD
jgi:hypothetical protein